MEWKVEGTHTFFLQHITGRRLWRIADGTWDMDRVEVVHEVEITQLATNYIGIWQETVAQWVALQPIFEVCAGKTGYWGGGHRREAWWRKGAEYKQRWATLEENSQEERSRRQQEGRSI